MLKSNRSNWQVTESEGGGRSGIDFSVNKQRERPSAIRPHGGHCEAKPNQQPLLRHGGGPPSPVAHWATASAVASLCRSASAQGLNPSVAGRRLEADWRALSTYPRPWNLPAAAAFTRRRCNGNSAPPAEPGADSVRLVPPSFEKELLFGPVVRLTSFLKGLFVTTGVVLGEDARASSLERPVSNPESDEAVETSQRLRVPCAAFLRPKLARCCWSCW